MTSESIISKVWSFCTTLRDDGVGYGDYLEQLTYLIFLKMADEYGQPPHHRDVGVPKKYAWPSLKRLKGAELEVHYLETLRALGTAKGILGQIFTKSQNKITGPAKLARHLLCPRHERERPLFRQPHRQQNRSDQGGLVLRLPH